MAQKQAVKKYNDIFRDFISVRKGCIFAVTDDILFYKTVHASFKYLGLDTRALIHRKHIDKVSSEARVLLSSGIYTGIIFLIENMTEGSSNVFRLRDLKSSFGDECRFITLTAETNRDNVAQIYEMGADNVIVKPVSIYSLVQKISLTFKPIDGLSQKINTAKSLILTNELEQADEVVQEILNQKPDSAAGFILKGDIAKAKGNFELAEDFYIKASRESKMYLKPLKKLVTLYEDMEDLEKKLEYLKKLDKISPLNYDRKIELGSTYLQLDDEENAVQSFNQAIRQVQRQARDIISSTMAKIARRIKNIRPELSTKYLEKAIEYKGQDLNRDDLWLFNEIAINLRQQGKLSRAIEFYQQALKIAPGDEGLYYNIGLAYAQGKQYYNALASFQKALELNPGLLTSYASVPYNIATTHAALKQNDKAASLAEKALSIDPSHKNARRLLKSLAVSV
ncbi:tetratricopeptide repeat protein [Desulfonatronospira sp.]|uniref:tetratricopeptide repeat protein n=1 Tax=Desulfonatronospira sp. TaxID=1962951 RepID=UPI0025C59244|nr:tetratricopeptide repeat protein [Desulfonatronospira sp.]